MCRLAPQPPARLVKKKGGKIDRNYTQKELNDQVDASSKAAAKKAVKDAKKVWEKAQKVKEDTQVAAEIPQQHTGHCSAGKKSLETGNADIEFNEDAIREDAVRCYQESREFRTMQRQLNQLLEPEYKQQEEEEEEGACGLNRVSLLTL